MKCDFSGWATRNDLLCEDGRTIRKDAFKSQDGETVPLVWSHDHNSPGNVLGHAVLENRDDGVYAYCFLNDTKSGQDAKEIVKHGDVRSLSIWANRLKESGGNVMHGVIRELSLVLSGANPGAFIENVAAHGDDADGGVILGYDESIMLYHSSDKDDDDDDDDDGESKKEPDEGKKKSDNEETVKDVFNTLTEKQKTVVYGIIGQLKEQLEKEAGEKDDNDDDDDDTKKMEHGIKGGKTMKRNVFENGDGKDSRTFLSHSAQKEILDTAKQTNVGSLQAAIKMYSDGGALQHDAVSSGFVETGDGNVYNLFPEYQEVRPGAPELITNDQGWVTAVMNKVHKSPISRIRTSQVDIRNASTLRARGYTKGKQKTQTGNFKLLRRTTDPQTVYVKDALFRDDIIDIQDFDYVSYLYGIDRMMLNEELATAIMLGDGRDDGDEGKISSEHIRPIWTDDDLYTIHVDVDIAAAKKELQGSNTSANFGENYVYAEAIITALLYARENYKGTGKPDFIVEPHLLNTMLLARDINGRRIYTTVDELASTLNVGKIYTAEQFANKTRTTSDSKTKKLLGIMVNLDDYSLGATKGGQVTHFTQFDMDFNQEKSLLETRVSGALTRVYSAVALEEDVTTTSSSATDASDDTDESAQG